MGSVGRRQFLVINQMVREGSLKCKIWAMDWTRNTGVGVTSCMHLPKFRQFLFNNVPYSPGKIIYLQCCPASHNCENHFYQLKIAKIKTIFPFQDLCVFSITQPSGSGCDLIIQASKNNSPTWYTCQSHIF